MSTRLTNDIRKMITRAVLRHRFNEQVDALIAERAEFADAVYRDVYSKPDRERMDALPKGWLPEESGLEVQCGTSGSRYERTDFDGSIYGPLRFVSTMKKDNDTLRRVLHKHARRCAKVYGTDHKLSVWHDEIGQRVSSLLAEYKTAEQQTAAALASVGTIKRLIEAWPEVAPFALPFEYAPKQLPSVSTETLNKLLDLPVAA